MRGKIMNISGLKVDFQQANPKTKDSDILLVHGMWAGSWMWENYMNIFSSQGYNCYALNLRGRPGSIPVHDRGKISINDYVTDVKNVAETLTNPIIIGHSMGGLLTQKVAELTSPEAVVLIGPAAPAGILMVGGWIHMAMGLYYSIDILMGNSILPNLFFVRHLLMNNVPKNLQHAIYEKLISESSRAAQEILFPGVSVDASKITCPMLVIASREDKATPFSIIQRIVDKYDCDLKTYSKFGHLIISEQGWEQPAKDILEWLDTQNN
jgi:alpha-beta hydrolase superfamily lysophospholipase